MEISGRSDAILITTSKYYDEIVDDIPHLNILQTFICDVDSIELYRVLSKDRKVTKNSTIIPENEENRKNKLNSDTLYLMFTSGTSTGKPAIVKGSYRSTLNRFKWMVR